MRIIFGIICFLGIIWSVATVGNIPLPLFLDLPSILVVMGVTISLGVVKYPLKELSSFSDEVVTSLIDFSLIGGGIGFFVGLTQMLVNMTDPESFGPAMSVNILTVFYSLIISACLYACKKHVHNRRPGVVAVIGSFAGFLPFIILYFKTL